MLIAKCWHSHILYADLKDKEKSLCVIIMSNHQKSDLAVDWFLDKIFWESLWPTFISLTHWGRVTHICVSILAIIGSDNGLSPGRRQAIIWTNAGILLIRTLGTNFSEILGEIHSFSFSKMHLKMSSAKWRLFGLGLNELIRFINCLTMESNKNLVISSILFHQFAFTGLNLYKLKLYYFVCPRRFMCVIIAEMGQH